MASTSPIPNDSQRPVSWDQFFVNLDDEVRELALLVYRTVYDFFATIFDAIHRGYIEVQERVITLIEPKKKFTTLLWKIPLDDRSSFLDDVLSVVAPSMGQKAKEACISAAKNSNTCDALERALFPFITQKMLSSESIEAITFMTNFSPESRRDLTRLINQLSDKPPSSYAIGQVFAEAATIPIVQRDGVLFHASQIILAAADTVTAAAICSVLKSLTQLASTGENLTDAVIAAQKLMTPEMSLRDKAEVLSVFSNFPLENRNRVVEIAAGFFPENAIQRDKYALIQAITKLPKHRKENVAMEAKRLITPSMNTEWRLRILTRVNEIENTTKNRLSTCVTHTLSFIQENVQAIERIDFLSCIARIESTYLHDVIRSAKKLIEFATSEYTLSGKRSLITSLSSLAVLYAGVDDITQYLMKLISKNPDSHKIEQTIQAIIKIPKESRARVIDAVAKKSPQTMLTSELVSAIEVESRTTQRG